MTPNRCEWSEGWVGEKDIGDALAERVAFSSYYWTDDGRT